MDDIGENINIWVKHQLTNRLTDFWFASLQKSGIFLELAFVLYYVEKILNTGNVVTFHII